ncbi:uncharacterized protein N7498_008756 [Penicillium cinerascens]|uniref:Uncharacterized protein n=1 Tax=Penicillium cinerascens TaxID=70096 RepID=A0A9W9JEE0_9EURO|nr:uncharacterized protein N7498_008756 [Penicillium cinerascens]KAJ5195318.1 hypothetical protein N7498_008756 [Penicillium cinerascens]
MSTREKMSQEPPPPYTKYDWKEAEKYYEAFESLSLLQKLKYDYDVVKAAVHSPYVHQSPEILTRHKEFLQSASSGVKQFRRDLKKGKIPPSELERRRQCVYTAYAQAMNEIERWTEFRFDSIGGKSEGNWQRKR